MNEILYELRDHSAGLNCGRWDYIFSYIKTLREHADCVMPDRYARVAHLISDNVAHSNAKDLGFSRLSVKASRVLCQGR